MNRGLLFSLIIKHRSIKKFTDGEVIVACVYEIGGIAAIADPNFIIVAAFDARRDLPRKGTGAALSEWGIFTDYIHIAQIVRSNQDNFNRHVGVAGISPSDIKGCLERQGLRFSLFLRNTSSDPVSLNTLLRHRKTLRLHLTCPDGRLRPYAYLMISLTTLIPMYVPR